MEVIDLAAIVVGIVALVIGAEWLVRGSSRIAARFGLSNVVIGLTVVAFGTSAPELAVSVGDVVRGSEEAGSIAIGNVVGSNIANILLALGLGAAVGGALIVASRIVRIDVPIMIGVSIVFFLMALNERLERWEGLLLTLALNAYVTGTVVAARRGTAIAVELEFEEGLSTERLRERSIWIDVLFVLGGLGFLVIGASSLVSGASGIAAELGVSDLVIGLTIVAVGTSLPEVATTVVAAIRGQRDLAVGNAIGSNLFNLLAVLGITALVSPKSLPIADTAIRVDIPVMIVVAVACLPIFMDGAVLRRWEGAVFFAYYVLYLGWLVVDSSGHDSRDAYRTAVVYFIVPLTALTIAVVVYRARQRDRFMTFTCREPRPAGDSGGDQRGSDDAGVVRHLGGDDLGGDVEVRDPSLRLLARPTAEDEQVGREQRLDVAQVVLHANGPFVPLEVVALAGARGGLRLGVEAVELQVTELGVGDEHAVDEQSGADPGAEGQHHHDTASTPTGAELHLGDTRSIAVVDHVNLEAAGLREHGVGVDVDPRRVDVGGRSDDTIADDRRERTADRAGPPVMLDELTHDPRHCVRCGRPRRVDAVAIGPQLAGVEVDDRRLHPGAADVDSEREVRCVAHGARE